MRTYLIRYYDINWCIHSATITAKSPKAACQILIAACTCTQSEIITYYQIGEYRHVQP